jgi:phosphoglycolate phosphatase-like HAD superfamily hydrolase
VTGHVVWDWNGTLLDDHTVMLAAVNDVCAAYGAAPTTLAGWHAALRRPLWLCYSDILGIRLTEDDWPTVEGIFHDAYRRRMFEAGLTPGARQALQRVRRSRLSQSVLSMAFHADVTAQVERAGIRPFFRAVDGVTDKVSGGTKAPYLAAHLRELGLLASAVLVVGDIPDDGEAARSVGARAVLVAHETADRAALAATGQPVTDSVTAAVDLILS